MLGINLRYFREKAGLTQFELADRSGVSRALIASLETGAKEQAHTTKLTQLASALGVSLRDLIAVDQTSTPIEAQLSAFRASDYFKDAKITEDELRWLRTLPAATWIDCKPSNRTLLLAIEMYRSRVTNGDAQ